MPSRRILFRFICLTYFNWASMVSGVSARNISSVHPPALIRTFFPLTLNPLWPLLFVYSSISRIPNRTWAISETLSLVVNFRCKSYSSGLPRLCGHQILGFLMFKWGNSLGVNVIVFRPCGPISIALLNFMDSISPSRIPDMVLSS